MEAPTDNSRERSSATTNERIRSRITSFCCSKGTSICLLLFLAICLVILVLYLFCITPIVFRVTNVSLIQFDLYDNNTLDYNLTVDMNVRNPNRVLEVLYHEIEVKVFYKGNRFDSANVMPFVQGRKVTTTLQPILFKGETVLVPSPIENNNDVLHRDYVRDKSVGIFDIRVQILARISRLKRFYVSKPRFKCDLKRVPLISSNGGSSGANGSGFQIKKKCPEYYVSKFD